MDLRALLGQQAPCPECEHGALKAEADFERGYCDACYMLKHDGIRIERQKHQAALGKFSIAFPVVAVANERQTFRSEAEAYAYDRSIYDTD